MVVKNERVAFTDVTLDQWTMFVAVCREGGVQAAARQIGRGHSTVSQALKALRQAVGEVSLFELDGRRLVPNAHGRVVLGRARRLLESAHALEGSVRRLGQGWESDVRVAVDGIVPRSWLAVALPALREQASQTRVRFVHVLKEGARAAAADPQFDLVLTASLPDGVTPGPVGLVRMAPVVAAHVEPLPDSATLERWVQVVLADTHPAAIPEERGWLRAARRWTVADIETAAALLQAGEAFAILPIEAIGDRLDRGELVRVSPPSQDTILQIHLCRPKGDQTGPAAQVLATAFRKAVSRL